MTNVGQETRRNERQEVRQGGRIAGREELLGCMVQCEILFRFSSGDLKHNPEDEEGIAAEEN
jgi:hypothetical protein